MFGVYIPTFNRPDVLEQTIVHLRKNLVTTHEWIVVVGVDDEDPRAAEEGLKKFSPQVVPLLGSSGSLGANVNRCIRFLANSGIELHMGMDDDHWLVGKLWMDAHLSKMQEDGSAGRIHLMMDATGDEHFDHYKFRATMMADRYWHVHWDSPERFMTSFRPHLVHQRWWDRFGMLPEGLNPGETEWFYSGHVKDNGLRSQLEVLVPLRANGFETWMHGMARSTHRP